MKSSLSHLDRWRIQEPHPSEPGSTSGVFQIPHPDKKERERLHTYFNIISTSGGGWDHVSIHVRYIKDAKRMMRCPTWAEMCAIKEAFFNDDEAVVQFHPAKADYVNDHPCVLHLWKPVGIEIPKPPKIFV